MDPDELMKQLINQDKTQKSKLPSIEPKKNFSTNPDLEREEIHVSLLEFKQLLERKRIEKNNTLITAEWNTNLNEAKVTKNFGSHLQIFGHTKSGSIFLYPEETLFLMEMNNLQLFYNEVRLSIQRSYGILLDNINGISTNEYRIYKHFAIHGYRLFRHHENSPQQASTIEETKNANSIESADVYPSCSFLATTESRSSETKVESPSVLPRIDGAKTESGQMSTRELSPVSYSGTSKKKRKKLSVAENIFKKLQIFNHIATEDIKCENIFKISYDVYLPNTIFKKSNRPEPHYKLIILSTDESIWNIMQTTMTLSSSTPLIFASIVGTSISLFNLEGITIPNMFG